MSIEFSMEVSEKKNVPVIRIKGEIDVYTCPKLNKTLTGIIEKGNHNFILNLEDIQYIDSTGLGTIAHSARSISEKNGTIFVVCAKPQIKKVFEIAGLNKKNIKLFDEEESALNAVPSSK